MESELDQNSERQTWQSSQGDSWTLHELSVEILRAEYGSPEWVAKCSRFRALSMLIESPVPLALASPESVEDEFQGEDLGSQPVRVVVLTRDSAGTISDCVRSIPRHWGVTLVDHDSQDETVEIALDARRDVSVISAEWKDDFSASRNLGASSADSCWVVHLDSDEVIPRQFAEDLEDLLRVLNLHPSRGSLAVALGVHGVGMESTAFVGRCYWSDGLVRYSGAVHESLVLRSSAQLDGSSRTESAVEVVFRGVVTHSGYTFDGLSERSRRNVALLDEMIEDDPESLNWRFYRGRDGASIRPASDTIDDLEAVAIRKRKRQAFAGDPVRLARKALIQLELEESEYGNANYRLQEWFAVESTEDFILHELRLQVRYAELLSEAGALRAEMGRRAMRLDSLSDVDPDTWESMVQLLLFEGRPREAFRVLSAFGADYGVSSARQLRLR